MQATDIREYLHKAVILEITDSGIIAIRRRGKPSEWLAAPFYSVETEAEAAALLAELARKRDGEYEYPGFSSGTAPVSFVTEQFHREWLAQNT